MPLDFSKPKGTRGSQKCFHRECEKQSEARVQMTARLIQRDEKGRLLPGSDQMIASRQHGFCKEHASEVYDALYAILERDA